MKRSIASGLSGLLLSSALWAAPATPVADKEKIVALVGQLGSNSFRERESAMRELEALGEPALDKLREAAKSTDPEVVTRASKLVERIGVKVRTAKLLSPTVVELDLQNVTVKEALVELSKQSGYDVLCPNAKTEKRITLKTGRVPFMRALELVCQQADLVEEAIAPSPVRPPRITTIRGGIAQPMVMPVAPIQLVRPVPVPIQVQVQVAPVRIAPPIQVEEVPAPKAPKLEAPKIEAPKLEVPKLEVPKIEAPKLEVPKLEVPKIVAPPVMVAPPIRFQRIEMAMPPELAAPVSQGSRSMIVLKEGKAEIYPSHIEGPVRISLRPESAMKLPPPPLNTEAPLYLVVEAEPKFPIVAIAGVTIKKAIDDQNQNLVRVPSENPTDADVIANLRNLRLQAAESRVLEARNRTGMRSWPVMFQKTAKASKSLVEVSGTVSVSVQMPTANLVEIDLDKNGKGKGESKAGATVEIVGLTKNADGSYAVEVGIAEPQNGPVRNNLIIRGGGQFIIDGVLRTGPAEGAISLLDKDGNALKQGPTSSESVSINGTSVVTRSKMTFKPNGKSGEPVRFVQTGNTIETIEIPFTLKDVPLK